MSCIGIGGHVIAGGGDDAQTADTDIGIAMRHDAHAGLAMDGHVFQNGVDRIFDQDRRAVVEGVPDVELHAGQIVLEVLEGELPAVVAEIFAAHDAVFAVIHLTVGIGIIGDVAGYGRAFAGGELLAEGDDEAASALRLAAPFQVRDNALTVGLALMVDGQTLDGDVFAVQQGQRLHEAVDHQRCAVSDHGGAGLSFQGNAAGIGKVGGEHGAFGIVSVNAADDVLHGLAGEGSADIVYAGLHDQRSVWMLTQIRHSIGKQRMIVFAGKAAQRNNIAHERPPSFFIHYITFGGIEEWVLSKFGIQFIIM